MIIYKLHHKMFNIICCRFVSKGHFDEWHGSLTYGYDQRLSGHHNAGEKEKQLRLKNCIIKIILGDLL